jgi:hypothetical protein
MEVFLASGVRGIRIKAKRRIWIYISFNIQELVRLKMEVWRVRMEP